MKNIKAGRLPQKNPKNYVNYSYFQISEHICCLNQKIQQCFVAYSNNHPHNKYSSLLFEDEYELERKVLIWMIRKILETGNYTLDGIANETRLPVDVVCEGALGLQAKISVTLWLKIANLYLSIYPDLEHLQCPA